MSNPQTWCVVSIDTEENRNPVCPWHVFFLTAQDAISEICRQHNESLEDEPEFHLLPAHFEATVYQPSGTFSEPTPFAYHGFHRDGEGEPSENSSLEYHVFRVEPHESATEL